MLTILQKLVSSVFFLYCFVCVNSSFAQAEKKKGAIRKAPAVSYAQGPIRLREGGITIGRSRTVELINKDKQRKQKVATESSFVRTHQKAKKKTRSLPKNAYQKAFAELQKKASEVSPHLGGRLRVSFTIGSKGIPEKVIVVGIDAKLDQILTAHLSRQAFPESDSGVFYASKLRIVATTPKKKTVDKGKKTRKVRR